MGALDQRKAQLARAREAANLAARTREGRTYSTSPSTTASVDDLTLPQMLEILDAEAAYLVEGGEPIVDSGLSTDEVTELRDMLRVLDAKAQALEAQPSDIEALLPGLGEIDLDDLQLGKQIGHGTEAQVYHVTNTNPDNGLSTEPGRYVLRIDKDNLGSATGNYFEERREYKENALGLSNLEHPNVVDVKGYTFLSETRGDFGALLMEYVEGPTLSESIKPELEVGVALEYTRQKLDGVQSVHRQGVLHRDLKPCNVIVQDDGTLKIVDLGLARKRPDGSWMGTMEVGSQVYASPDQIAGNPSERSDVYSLGMMLYEELLGRRIKEMVPDHKLIPGHAYQHIDREDLEEKVFQRTGRNREAAKQLSNLVMNMIKPDPKERYSTEQASADLERATAALEGREFSAIAEAVATTATTDDPIYETSVRLLVELNTTYHTVNRPRGIHKSSVFYDTTNGTIVRPDEDRFDAGEIGRLVLVCDEHGLTTELEEEPQITTDVQHDAANIALANIRRYREETIEGLVEDTPTTTDISDLATPGRKTITHRLNNLAREIEHEFTGEERNTVISVKKAFDDLITGGKLTAGGALGGLLLATIMAPTVSEYVSPELLNGAGILSGTTIGMLAGFFNAKNAYVVYRSGFRSATKPLVETLLYVRKHIRENIKYDEQEKISEFNLRNFVSEMYKGARYSLPSKVREYASGTLDGVVQTIEDTYDLTVGKSIIRKLTLPFRLATTSLKAVGTIAYFAAIPLAMVATLTYTPEIQKIFYGEQTPQIEEQDEDVIELEESDYELAEGDEIEWYDSRFKFGDPESEMDIHIPIKKNLP